MESPTRSGTPNAHPYPIKTTSTGILTRSNSSNAHGSLVRHNYTQAVPIHSPDLHGSLSRSPTRGEGRISLSPSPSKYSHSWVGRSPAGESIKLPKHPYLWSPAHLGTYLSTVLKGPNGEPLEVEIVQRIVDFVHTKKIGGRAFLGLDQEDFQEMDGADSEWADALWDAACALRASVASYRPSRVSSGAYKRGRVRGIVGVFERSASESSDAGEDNTSRRRLRSSGSGYESTDDDAPLSTAGRNSAARTPRPSHGPDSPGTDWDNAPNARDVEVVSLAGSNLDSEPSMAELYERTYGIPAPTRRPVEADENDIVHRKTVEIAEAPLSGEQVDVIRLPKPAPPNLAELFVPQPSPVHEPERHLPIPSPVAPDLTIVLPPGSGDSNSALHALGALKARLTVVEDRVATLEHKHKINTDVVEDTEDGTTDDPFARWSETRQSAYILFAGAAAGVSVVLVPLLFRHFWAR